MIAFVPLAQIEPAAVEQLLDRAFGTDRRDRTAYRLREGVTPVSALSFAALDDGALIGSIQCWPVAFTDDDGTTVSMTMVGPVAVEPGRQMGGVGKQLMQRALAAAEEAGLHEALMLVGDPEYYARFFGFAADRTGGWRLPGPVERHRLLARGAAVPAGDGTLSVHATADA